MTDLRTLGFLLGTLGMFAGTLYPLYRLVTDDDNTRYYAVLAAVPAIATVAYLLMFLGVGTVQGGGRAVELARYVDWLLTTPLLVLFLAWLASADRELVAAATGIDVVVIGAGFAGVLASGPLRWVGFGVGTVAYIGLVVLLMRTIPRRAAFDSQHVAAMFTKLRNLTIVLWSLYPVVWLLSGTGIGLLQPASEVLVVVYLDLITKVAFVTIATNGHETLSEVGAGTDVEQRSTTTDTGATGAD